MIKSVATVGFYTILSRIMGFARDMFIASVLGTGPVADAFYVGFRFPNFFRRLFAEGAFNSAFVPTFTHILTKEGPEKARIASGEIFSTLASVLIGLVIIVELTAPWLVELLTPGFIATPERFEVTVEYTRIMFPYIFFASLAALYTGVLNSIDKFAVGAASPILMNVVIIIAMLFFAETFETAGHALSWAVAISGVLQFYWLHRSCVKNNFALKLRLPKLTPSVRRVMKLMIPGAFAAGVIQMNIMVGIIFLSFLPSGAISYFFYADRLHQLPLSLIGIAISTALLPTLARQLAAGKKLTAHYTQNRALEFSLFLTLPASIAYLIDAEPIIRVLFERHNFTAESTLQTARVLAAFSLGLPAYVLVKILSTTFFARHDTKTPLHAAILAVITNIVFDFILISPYEHVGIALATSIASWVNACWLIYKLQSGRHFVIDRRLRDKMPKIVSATIFMGLLLEFTTSYSDVWLHGGQAVRTLALLGLVSTGILSYFIASMFFRSIDLVEFRSYLVRRKKNSQPAL